MFPRLSSSVSACLILVGLVAASGACSDDEPAAAAPGSSSSGSSGNSSGGEATLTSGECTSRCSDKLTSCPSPLKDQADLGCSALCAQSITESQATCLEDKTCNELGEAFSQGKDLDALCPKKSTTSSSSGNTSSSGNASSSGSSGEDYPPKSLTVTAQIPSNFKATHVKDGDDIGSIFSFGGDAELSDDYPALQNPDLNKGTITLDSPERPEGACGTSKFTFTLSRKGTGEAEVSVQISGTDTLPETGCATFTDDLVEGATWTITNVPWPNSTTKGTVKIVLE